MALTVPFPWTAVNLTNGDVVSGDQTLMILGTALVMFMTPGLAQFYGGIDCCDQHLLSAMLGAM